MNNDNAKYARFALTREMLDSAGVISLFNPNRVRHIAETVRANHKLMLTGEGSSRIFPAKNAIRKALRWGVDLHIGTDGARQAAQYNLSDYTVLAASNSGRTREVVTLLQSLEEAGHDSRFGLTAHHGTLLAEVVNEAIVLSCGAEQAVAATKSVVEQALVYQAIVSAAAGRDMLADLPELDRKFTAALDAPIDPKIVEACTRAPILYFAGYNDGVAEELTLKANEITRKRSDYLEGTYAVHGIEEVMEPDDVLVLVDPIDDELAKFKEVLVDGVGLTVIAIADRDTPFATIRTAPAGEMSAFVYLAAGWNLLVEIGLALGINLDKPVRARKVGNEFMGAKRGS